MLSRKNRKKKKGKSLRFRPRYLFLSKKSHHKKAGVELALKSHPFPFPMSNSNEVAIFFARKCERESQVFAKKNENFFSDVEH